MKNGTFGIDRIDRLRNIFNMMRWLGNGANNNYKNVAFDRMCSLSSRLSDDQFDLFSCLLEEYTYIDFDYYNIGLMSALEKMTPSPNKNHIYRVAPLLKPNDYDKSKSGVHMVYSFKNVVWKRSNKFSMFCLNDHVSIKKLMNEEVGISPFTTIILDDFIGSGGTAEKFLDNYEKHAKKTNETIVFICIAAMKQGADFIIKRGYNIFYDRLFMKGIANSGKINDKRFAYEIMESIENMIKISSDYRLGYKKSEALVSMMRTPNNTFPMFWVSNSLDGTDWPAPFPR